jgi:hypothetical protein
VNCIVSFREIHAAGLINSLPQGFGSQLISTWNGVGVDVERRRSSGVAQARRPNLYRDASIEHLRCHKVPQVVESEVIESCSPAHSDEALGHEIR